MKQTSLDTYRQIQINGTLRGLRLKVYEFIALNPGITITESIGVIGTAQSISGRFGELEQMGFIETRGERKIGKHNHGCYHITGRTRPLELNQQKLSEKIKTLKEKGYRYLNDAARLEKEIYENIRG